MNAGATGTNTRLAPPCKVHSRLHMSKGRTEQSNPPSLLPPPFLAARTRALFNCRSYQHQGQSLFPVVLSLVSDPRSHPHPTARHDPRSYTNEIRTHPPSSLPSSHKGQSNVCYCLLFAASCASYRYRRPQAYSGQRACMLRMDEWVHGE
ncbi:hypothetical protein BDQ17DRAFT_753765 [Cyathus striatus]|nr:hypothetical protein BDQ17DRAFT_753765 [Cyathus striatus]